MATKRNRPQVDYRPGMPAAQTFRALNVPHIGPQRRETEAANFMSLANSLGKFNSALQGLGPAFASIDKKAEEKASVLERYRGVDPDSMHQETVINGNRVVLDTTQDVVKFKSEYLPQFQANEEEYLAQQDAVGWLVPDQSGDKTMTVTNPETGESEEVPARRRSISDVAMYYDQVHDSVLEKYADRPELALELAEEVDKAKGKAMVRLDKYRRDETKRDALETSRAVATSNLVANINGNPDQIAKSVMESATKHVATFTREASRGEVIETVFNEFDGALDNGGDDMAKAVIKFVEGSPDRKNMPQSFIQHERYSEAAHKLRRKAEKILANSKAAAEVELEIQEKIAAASQRQVRADQWQFEDVIEETSYGDKVTITASQIKQKLAENLERQVMFTGNARRDIPKNQQFQELAFSFAGLPVKSPTLETVFEVFEPGGDPQQFATPAASDALMAFKQLRSAGPLAADAYVTGKKKKFLEMVTNLTDEGVGMSEEQAFSVVNQYFANGEKMSLDGDIEDALRDFNLKTLSRSEQEQVKDTVRLMNLNRRNVSKSEVRSQLRKVKEHYEKYTATLNDHTFKLPMGVETPDAYADFVKKAVTKMGEDLGVDTDDIYLERYDDKNGGGYIVVDKDTGMYRPNPKSDRRGIIRITDKMIRANAERLDRLSTKEEVEKARKVSAEKKAERDFKESALQDAQERHKRLKGDKYAPNPWKWREWYVDKDLKADVERRRIEKEILLRREEEAERLKAQPPQALDEGGIAP